MSYEPMAVRAALSALAVGAVFMHAFGGKSPRARLALRAALVAACLCGVGNYFSFDRRQLVEVRDYYDVTFYYLNSKYFDELGYRDLYRAMLLADEAGERQLDHVRVARDLGDYRNRPRAELMRDAATLRTRFEPARWQEFQREVAFLVRQRSPGQLDYFFKDHGYNATPSWTVLGSALSRAVDVRALKWITSIDLLLLAVMFGVLRRSFGLDVMLFALLFFTCTHSGRWPVAGQALLRFDWLVALVTGYCALMRGRPLLGGALLGYAAQARLFPAVYLIPVGLGWLALWLKERRVPASLAPTTLGFGAVLVLSMGAAALCFGTDALIEAAHRLRMHAGPESYSSLRVGLGDALVFRGERYWPLLGAAGGIPDKAAQVAELLPWTRLIALALCGLIGLYALRRRPAPESLTPLGGLLLFALFNPQINYLNARLLWLPFHLQEPARARNVLGLALLFATEVAANAAHQAGAIDYAVTSLSSIGLALHALCVCVGLLAQTRRGPTELAASRPRSAGLAALGLISACGVLAGYWAAGARPEPARSVALAALTTHVPDGARWDRADVHRLDPSGIRVELGDTQRARTLSLAHDQDDHYELVFERNGHEIARRFFGARGRGPRGTLVHTRLSVPRRAAEDGYDALRILPSEGDSRFGVADLRLHD